eukprot:6029380-Lingulodinium_polyedra.AAC.1
MDFERLLAARPARQTENAVGTRYGSKLLDMVTEDRPIRNVMCNLAWTNPTANTSSRNTWWRRSLWT